MEMGSSKKNLLLFQNYTKQEKNKPGIQMK